MYYVACGANHRHALWFPRTRRLPANFLGKVDPIT